MKEEGCGGFLLNGLVGRRRIGFRPTILVGSPGSGKTTFAEEFLSALGVRHETYPCGGVGDAALAGTARRWSSGEPSLPVALVQSRRTASPGIILDEVEKVGTGRHNGNLLDALLGLLEPQSSSHWHDPFIEASVDLSNVIWLGTANSLDGLSKALRDRCAIVEFPDPRAEDLDALAPRLLAALAAERGLDPRWAAPLDGDEREALRAVWRGGSLRRLNRLVEGVFNARGRTSALPH